MSFSVNSQSIDSMINFKNYDNHTSLCIISYTHDSTDCGEWGGHSEQITIRRFNGKLKINYIRKSSDCENVTKEKKSGSQIEYSDTLTVIKQEYVKIYLKELLEHTPNKGHPEYKEISNAPNRYEVQFQNGFMTYSFKINDDDDSWKKYEPFRTKLIK